MLRRICLILAILAAGAAVGLNITGVKKKITALIEDRDKWHAQFTKTDADLTKSKKDLAATKTELKQTQDKLVATTDERDKAVKKADSEAKRSSELADKLTKTTQERDDAKSELARYTGTGLTVEQILAFDKVVKQTKEALEVANEEKKVLQRTYDRLFDAYSKIVDPEYIVLEPAVRAKIVVCDPKWDFVVLDVGEQNGIKPDGEFLVSRDGKLVAKVRVTNVQKDRSIANVVPGWKLSEVVEGDQVIPAHPAS